MAKPTTKLPQFALRFTFAFRSSSSRELLFSTRKAALGAEQKIANLWDAYRDYSRNDDDGRTVRVADDYGHEMTICPKNLQQMSLSEIAVEGETRHLIEIEHNDRQRRLMKSLGKDWEVLRHFATLTFEKTASSPDKD